MISDLIAAVLALFRRSEARPASPEASPPVPPGVPAVLAAVQPIRPALRPASPDFWPPAAPVQASQPETPIQQAAPAGPVVDWLAICRPLSQHFESCYLTAYPDPASPLGKELQARGIWYRVLGGMAIPDDAELRALSGAPWTCGWGSTGADVRQGAVWTQATADARHDENLIASAALVDRAVKVALAPHEKAALTSIMNNVGPGRAARGADEGRDGIVVLASGASSTLLRMLNAGARLAAADQFLVWNRAGGVVSDGLKRRRAAERDLFLTGEWS
ncbi:lysozyme [Burkholderia gladioli]|uniref:lysozyme n=1 Tax=Burkholderia gladioli TaxID=28095 RepID=UPI001C22AA64|nr:lysozyme [Burkholderia gladioli]MBU9268171.1 lysozyme [Burkholderia gladioli]